MGGEREGSGGGAGVSGGGLDHGGLGALGDGEEGSGEGNGGKRKGVKESRGTYFFCKYSSFFLFSPTSKLIVTQSGFLLLACDYTLQQKSSILTASLTSSYKWS